MTRKVIQISAVSDKLAVFALCDDGTIFCNSYDEEDEKYKWVKVDDVPQPKEESK